MEDEMWLCPISHEIMKDPVTASDGHSYERAQIEAWFLKNDISPLTGQKILNKNLIPNHALKSAIERYTLRTNTLSQAATSMSQEVDSARLNIVTTTFTNGVHIALDLPINAKSKRLALVAVLDISGSMGLPSQEKKANSEGSRFSRIDLLIHSMNTAIELLGNEDYLALVTFNDKGELLLNFTLMNKQGKSAAHKAINSMKASGSTNLWGGLLKGIDLALMPPESDMNVAILLQTDGEPTNDYIPPRGILKSLENKLSNVPTNSLTIHCCGYGYGEALDTPLLRSIASHGRGTFAYIPDGSMVGTVFIHLLANLVSVVLPSVAIEIKVKRGIMDDLDAIQHIGFMRAGQTRDCWIPFKGILVQDPSIEITQVLNCFPYKANVTYQRGPPSACHFQSIRSRFVNDIAEMITLAENGQVQAAKDKLEQLDAYLVTFPKDSHVKSMRDDLKNSSADKGQIEKALTFWDKWGRHYLPAIWIAHARQEKSNFKDASMDMYSTFALDEFVHRAEEIFATLPPAVSTLARYETNTQQPAPSMRGMIDRHGGCFTGDSLVEMDNGKSARIDSIKPGMMVKGGFKVVCVIRYRNPSGEKQISRSASKTLGITPYHPLRTLMASEWVFPCQSNKFKTQLELCPAVYNFVLDSGHYIEVDGFNCCTLAHGFVGNVISHPYFGSTKCLEDLRNFIGFVDGYVTVNNPCFTRDPQTNLINGCYDAEPGLTRNSETNSMNECYGTTSNFCNGKNPAVVNSEFSHFSTYMRYLIPMLIYKNDLTV